MLMVLMLNTIFGALYLSPVIISNIASGHWGLGDTAAGHGLILIKAVIVLSSWILGYFAIKHLPLTIQGPINATRPVIVLVGALCLFGERLNLIQWAGITIGFASLYFISRIGAKEGFSLRHSRWLWMSIGAMALGAASALFDKYLLRSYKPLEVQAWYSLYQCFIMSALLLALMRRNRSDSGNSSVRGKRADRFQWRWTIPFIALFLTVADLCYFYSLSVDGSMISIVSMIRRGSVIIPFLYGVLALHETNVKAKLIDLSLLMLSLVLLVIGS